VVGREEEERTRAFATMRSAGWCGVWESADTHTHTHISAAAAYTVAEGNRSHERERERARERGREIVGMNSKRGSRVLGIGAASPGELEEEVVSLRGRGGAGFAAVHTGEDVTHGVCAGLPAVDTAETVMRQSSHTLGSQNRGRGGIQWYSAATSSCAEEVILKSSHTYQVPPLAAAELMTCDTISRTVAGVGDTHSHGDALQHTATHCNTLQHTATHCNTLQNTTQQCWRYAFTW